VIGEIEIIGTLSSLATATIAIEDGAVAVPISRSTLFSSTSLRALRVAVDGSEPSSSWIRLIFSSPTALAYSHAAFMPRSYSTPIEEPGPLSEVTNPTLISACAGPMASDTPAPIARARRSCLMAVSSVAAPPHPRRGRRTGII